MLSTLAMKTQPVGITHLLSTTSTYETTYSIFDIFLLSKTPENDRTFSEFAVVALFDSGTVFNSIWNLNVPLR